jgi:ubiquinone/menaquinone biosynthesis C-methylase UbiE
MAVPTPWIRGAYRAQHAALRWSIVTAHLGLRPFLRPRRVPGVRELGVLERRFSDLLARDLANVEVGNYPQDLLFQLPVREYLSGLPRLSVEVGRMVRRARARRVRDLPEGVDLARFPDYFRRNFHWQTDGYLSRRSAELYDLSVEFLFLGVADVMRRQVIPPLSRFFAARPGAQRVLDVGTGTGRTLHQLCRAHPGHRYFGVDLSGYYIDRARELLAGRDVSLLVDNAENLPLADGSFDAVTSVFLFHELPLAARRNVLAEVRRVLRPGGLFVLEDAAQLADSPELELFLENFGRDMNEPFFLEYLRHDLTPEIERAGFRVRSVDPCFLAKVVVAEAV